MSNELAVRTTTITAFEPRDLNEAITLSKTLSASALIPQALKKKPEDVLAIIMAGRELGLPPMASIRGISIIEGKPTMESALIVGLCLRRADICEQFQLIASDDKAATYEAKRRGSPPVRLTFTMEEAKRAELTGKANWRRWPAAMLRARCASHLARSVFPDVTAGVYDLDEGDDIKRGTIRARVDSAPTVEATLIESTQVEAAPWDEQPAPVAAGGGNEPPNDPADAVRARIREAQSIEALTALVPEIKALAQDAQTALRTDYGKRRGELTRNGASHV